MKEMLWNEQYNLGIEEIDHVHQRLFYLVHQLACLNEAGAEQPACRESVEFLKKYSLHHLAAEERYMQYTGYEGYQVHKALHVQWRDEMFPALENELEQTSFSQDAVAHFLRVYIGWLAGHILVEDRAMISKAAQGDAITLEQSTEQVFNMVSKQKAQLLDEHYDYNKEAACNEIIYYYFQYASGQKENVQVVLGIEEKAVLSIFSAMLGVEFQKLDMSMLYAAMHLFGQLLKMTAVEQNYLEQYKLEKEEHITQEQLSKMMENMILKYSLTYDIGYGTIVFSVVG